MVEVIPLENMDKGIGELCLTMIVPGAKPLIRFKTGDLVQINNKNSPKTLKVLGRVKDILIINSKKMSPYFIESSILSEFPKTFGYQCTLWLDNNLKENMTINVVSNIKDNDLKFIEEKLKEKFNINVCINKRNQLDPKTETGAYVSWKNARIIDRR